MICDEACRNMVGRDDMCAFKDLPAVKAKGYVDPVKIFVPYQAEISGKMIVHHKSHNSMLVGRDAELKLVLSSLDAMSRGDGTQRLVMLGGEAGIGKTELLGGIRAHCGKTGVGIIAVAGAAETVIREPLLNWQLAVLQLTQMGAEAGKDVSIDVTSDHDNVVQYLTAVLDKSRKHLYLLLAAIFPSFRNIPQSGELKNLQGTPRGIQLQAEMVIDIIAAASKVGPIMLQIDDAHFLKDFSWKMVHGIVSRNLTNVLVVVAMRPMKNSDKGSKGDKDGNDMSKELKLLVALPSDTLKKIDLQPLDAESCCEILCDILHNEELSDELVTVVYNRCKGNPMFLFGLADFIASDPALLKEGASLENLELALPANIQAVVTTRVDGLDSKTRLALKVASVLGYQFSKSLLFVGYPTIPRKKEQIQEIVKTLVDAEFVSEGQDDKGEPCYTFKNSVILDTVYDMMLSSQKAEIHQRLGQYYERVFKVFDKGHASSASQTPQTNMQRQLDDVSNAQVEADAQSITKYELLTRLALHWSSTDNLALGIFYVNRAAKYSVGCGEYMQAEDLYCRALELNNLVVSESKKKPKKRVEKRDTTIDPQVRKEMRAEENRRIREESTNKSIALCVSICNLATMYTRYRVPETRFFTSEELLDRAFETQQELEVQQDQTALQKASGRALVLHNLAFFYMYGRHEEAKKQRVEEYFVEAVQLRKAAGMLPETAETLNGLGSFYEMLVSFPPSFLPSFKVPSFLPSFL
jgi:hypothetical protein